MPMRLLNSVHQVLLQNLYVIWCATYYTLLTFGTIMKLANFTAVSYRTLSGRFTGVEQSV